jgi:hypothetical protein
MRSKSNTMGTSSSRTVGEDFDLNRAANVAPLKRPNGGGTWMLEGGELELDGGRGETEGEGDSNNEVGEVSYKRLKAAR